MFTTLKYTVYIGDNEWTSVFRFVLWDICHMCLIKVLHVEEVNLYKHIWNLFSIQMYQKEHPLHILTEPNADSSQLDWVVPGNPD